MKKIIWAMALCLVSANFSNADIIFNEIDYDQPGGDTGEFVEVAVADSMLASFANIQLEMFNQSGTEYGSYTFADFVQGGSQDGYTFFSVTTPSNGIQNGGNDGFGLSLTDGTTLELLSYEGTLTVGAGETSPWAGLTSTDIGVEDTNGSPNASLSRVGTAPNFTWAVTSTITQGAVNDGQSFAAVPEPTTAVLFGLAGLGLCVVRRR